MVYGILRPRCPFPSRTTKATAGAVQPACGTAPEDALGMKFTDEKGEHFFRSTLVQTLFYGVFSAWVRWHKDNPSPKAKFNCDTAEWSLQMSPCLSPIRRGC